jgi:hypothetical protein
VLFGVYNVGRYISAQHAGSAFDHAHALIGLQAEMSLPSEAVIQRTVMTVPELVRWANLYYMGVHFPLTAVVMLWLMVRRPIYYADACRSCRRNRPACRR